MLYYWWDAPKSSIVQPFLFWVANPTVILVVAQERSYQAWWHGIRSSLSLPTGKCFNVNARFESKNPTWIISAHWATGNPNLSITNLNIIIIYKLSQCSKYRADNMAVISNCWNNSILCGNIPEILDCLYASLVELVELLTRLLRLISWIVSCPHSPGWWLVPLVSLFSLLSRGAVSQCDRSA